LILEEQRRKTKVVERETRGERREKDEELEKQFNFLCQNFFSTDFLAVQVNSQLSNI